MSNAVQVFKNREFGAVRTIIKDGEPWFVAKDVAEALGYRDTTNAVKAHCRGVVKHHPYKQSVSGSQPVNIIPESDLYRLILRSRVRDAERFQDWVTMEILPSIRKTGSYSMSEKPEKEPTEKTQREQSYNPAQEIRNFINGMYSAAASEGNLYKTGKPAPVVHLPIKGKAERYTIKDVAYEINVSEQTVYRWVASGELASMKMPGKNGRIVILKKHLEDFKATALRAYK
ncbi:BRO family protein [Geovibrio ferrireducens]|uniref:BRO family protein n=1 Tax=Geovibrio ferrireducens TaxID=46201 RepID=UPI00224679C5|nr:BRO family protein [Geovibrio ferrireducens]